MRPARIIIPLIAIAIAITIMACSIPTDYNIGTKKDCHFPPPLITDTVNVSPACPYRLDDTTVVYPPGWNTHHP